MKALLVFTALFYFAVAQNTIVLPTIIRDFTPNGPSAHPDFEHWCCALAHGLVQPTLDSDGKPAFNSAFGDQGTQMLTSAADFAEWYRDGPRNIHIDSSITLTETAPGSGVYEYSNGDYFPIDGLGFGNYFNGHNFHFTTEIHTTFTYEDGQVFNFNGDDDVWVFIDGQLVIDIGGVHGSSESDLNLATLGFAVGSDHTLDVFQAERHTVASTFRMTTSIQLVPTTPPDNGRRACLCGVCISDFCTNSDQSTCPHDPTITFPNGAGTYGFENFNFISFGDIIGDTSDTEGRVIAKNSITFEAGYSVGAKLITAGVAAIDIHLPYAVVAGADLTWPSGAVFPNGNNGPQEYIFVGDGAGGFDGSVDLAALVTGSCPGGAGCLDNDFNNAQAYYTMFSQQLGAVGDNVNWNVQGVGLYLTCVDPNAASYSVTVDDATISSITWYSVSGCNSAAQWVINVAGSSSVTFGGDTLRPNDPEHMVWNILGSGRTVNCNTEVHGTLLAPQHTYNQANGAGVWVGQVIVADVTASHQINRLRCPQNPSTPPNDDNLCTFFETTCAGLTFPLGNSIYSFRDFNVVSFSDFNANTGDVEGRVGVAGNMNVGAGFSVGYQLQTLNGGDRDLPYAVVVGHDCTFVSGDVYPNGFNSPYPGNEEDLFVGGTFNGADYLAARVTGTCSAPGCLDSFFTAGQACYTGYQNTFDSHADTVSVNVEWSALELTCDSASDSRYYVHITPAQMNDATYYVLSNCNFQAEWVITISGTDDVNFHGDQFPAPSGAVVYNVVGSGRTITAGTGVMGSILAPNNILDQVSGVIIGKVVASNVEFSTQINKPDCYNPGTVVITAPTVAPSGTNNVDVTPNSQFNAGDTVNIAGSDYTIDSIDHNSDSDTLNLDSDIPYTGEGTKVSSTVDGTRSGKDTSSTTSGASATSVFFALVFAMLLFF